MVTSRQQTKNGIAMAEHVWEDKEIRFDLPGMQLKVRNGERVLDRLETVEDTKGNAGDRGCLMVTNLRVVWHSHTAPRVSLSIGFNCVIHISTKIVNSKLMGVVKALYILTRTPNARYEFIFSNLDCTMRHFSSVIGVHKAYCSSRMYRELKLRGALFQGRMLKVLPKERILNTLRGVWNLSSDQGNLGTLIVTNIRIVWFAEMNEHFNISLPYMQINMIKVRGSKFGEALVLEAVEASGGYVLGFRIDPVERLKTIAHELSTLHQAFSNAPEFGVDFDATDVAVQMENEVRGEQELQEIDDAPNEMSNALVTYYAAGGEGQGQPGGEPMFCPEFGLAVETPKDGFTVKSLWEVLTTEH